MLSLINAAKHFGFNAYGAKMNLTNLRELYFIHLNMNNNEHWSVIKYIDSKNVFLADSSEGNINIILEELNKYFTGNAIIISNETIDNFKIRKNKYLRQNSSSNLWKRHKKENCWI